MEIQFKTTQQKPIEVNLVGGNIELATHPTNSIIIDAGDMRTEGFMPQIFDAGDKIVISKQSLSSFLSQTEKIDIKITIPDHSDIIIKQTTGNLKVTGYYNNIQANVIFGNIKAGLADFQLRQDADFKVFVGNVNFTSTGETSLKKNVEKEKQLQFDLVAGGKVKAKTTLGETKIQPYFKKYKNPMQVFASLATL